MFYVLVFGLLAIVLVVAFFVTWSRRNSPSYDGQSGGNSSSTASAGVTHSTQTHHATSDAARKKRKAERAQSRHDRRKRH